MFKTKLNSLYAKLVNVQPVAPPELKENFSEFDSQYLGKLEELIVNNLLVPVSQTHHLSAEGKADIATHVDGRLIHFRNYYIPWMNSIRKIEGSSILEIGSGTGASTQALAEQGGLVQGIDVDEKVIEIARFRLKHCKQKGEFSLLNADKLLEKFSPGSFDIVIFFAALEHMTIDERINALKSAYALLKPGGALFVLEAPNRLWFYDMHTSFLPFYLWLPEELAIRYSGKSERKLFREAISDQTTVTEFARWGRGVSYHEFQLAEIPETQLSESKWVFEFHMKGKQVKKALYRLGLNYKYKKILRKLCPKEIPGSFLEPFLDLCIRK